jgi:hypothetical protein
VARYSLARDGEPVLSFDGTVLAAVSSSSSYKDRWTELALYESDGGKYVVQTIARSRRENETDWHSARVFDSPAATIEGLRDKKRGTLSKLALELLEIAADESLPMLDALESIEGTEEVIS